MASLDAGRVVAALRGAFAREVGRTELLRLAAERIRAAGAPYTSVYLYMLQGEELVLEAFAGRETDHTPDRGGQGRVRHRGGRRAGIRTCPTSAPSRTTSPATPGPAPSWWCSSAAGNTILGQIDVDSDEPDPFTPEEEAEVRKVAEALAVLL